MAATPRDDSWTLRVDPRLRCRGVLLGKLREAGKFLECFGEPFKSPAALLVVDSLTQ